MSFGTLFEKASHTVVLLTSGFVLLCGSLASAGDSPVRPLSSEDQQTLDEYLGAKVVGEAISPPVLTNGLNDLISLHDGLTWRMRVISGNKKGATELGSVALLNRPDSSAFRFDSGDGRNVLFGQLDEKGNLISYASQDNQQGVISRFTPAQPIFLGGMSPGQVQISTSNISVSDLSKPDVETHSGKLNIEFQYMGAYRLLVPAGDIDSVLFKTRLTGKVGPASVEDTIYRFFAKNSGPVAIVETNDVSALLIYHEKNRIGKVLVETITK
jgi:hypothetical protein